MKEGIEHAETFIGECADGSCDKPATVRVFEDFVLCAAHHHRYELDEDEVNLSLELLRPWVSQARMHQLDGLVLTLERLRMDLQERSEEIQRRGAQLDRAEQEENGDATRLKMGEAMRRQPEDLGAEGGEA